MHLSAVVQEVGLELGLDRKASVMGRIPLHAALGQSAGDMAVGRAELSGGDRGGRSVRQCFPGAWGGETGNGEAGEGVLW